jgi:hypothetical protein
LIWTGPWVDPSSRCWPLITLQQNSGTNFKRNEIAPLLMAGYLQ